MPNVSIGEYLIQRLQDYGIGHVFGIPGDYVLGFYSLLEKSPLEIVACTREDSAGFATDAYARMRGMGAVCVTYCVGGLSLCNSIAGAYAEKSPVVVITGSPGLSERVNNPLLHHRVRDFRTQYDVFEKLCIAGTELDDANVAYREIDRVLQTVARYKRPGYIEIPRDMVHVVPDAPRPRKEVPLVSDASALAEALGEAVQLIEASKKPVILAGVEIHRFGLQSQLLRLAEESGIPVTTTMLGKSVLSEKHPLFVGLYEGAMGNQQVTRFVEESDCVIMLGTFMTDINLGIFTANLDPSKCIYATSEALRLRHHHYHDVLLEDFMCGLCEKKPHAAKREIPTVKRLGSTPFVMQPKQPVTIERLMARLNEIIDNQTIVVADIGDALFAASELEIRESTEFISPAYYTSMGFSIPAALGCQVAKPDVRTVVIVGDGAFQMTGMELASIVRCKFPTIVILLDNKGYGTEKVLHPGNAFNDIYPWAYHKLPMVLGGGTGYEVRTEEEFDAALKTAWQDKSGMSLIQCHLGQSDHSTSLNRLAKRLGQRV